MRDHSDLDWALLADYVSGQATTEEQAVVARWMGNDPDRHALVQTLQEVHARRISAIQPPTELGAEIEHNVLSRVSSATTGERRAPTKAGSVRRWLGAEMSRTTRVALMSIVACLVVAFGLVVRHQHRGQSSSSSESSSPSRLYRTRAGETATIRVADGSTIRLAPATVAIIRTEKGTQNVEINGEAYFTVAPNAARSFVVTTRQGVVRVLGTRFAVRQYDGEPMSRIVVEDGRVALRASQQTGDAATVLSARMMALLSDSGVAVTSDVDTRTYTGWTQGSLVFNRTPLHDVVIELSRAYGANIRVADSALATEPVIAEVLVHRRPLTQVLDAIGNVLDAHYVRDGNAFVLLRGRRVKQEPSGSLRKFDIPSSETRYGR